MREILSTLLSEFEDKLELMGEMTVRDVQLTTMPNKVNVVVGMRRTGKTYFLYQQIKDLLQQGISLTRILYINFEDDRLIPCSHQTLANLVASFYELYPDNHDHTCYFLFDEIQNVEGWPTVIRRLLDSKKVTLYLSGSSAKLLSKEIATSLRGRSMTTEIWPYSFHEYLTAKHIKLEKKLKRSQKAMNKKRALLREYLLKGGFPETVRASEVNHQALLQEYVDVVIYRDIIERHNITNVVLIKYLIKTLLKNTATRFATHKFHNDLKSQGFSVGKNTLYTYMEYIEDAYMAFKVPLYSESLRKIQSNPHKIYAIDPGLAHAYTFGFNQNIGRLFENLVYLDLRRQGCEVYYYLTEERYEVDFLVREATGRLKLVQIAWDTTDKSTLEREIRALHKAETELGIKGELIDADTYLAKY